MIDGLAPRPAKNIGIHFDDQRFQAQVICHVISNLALNELATHYTKGGFKWVSSALVRYPSYISNQQLRILEDSPEIAVNIEINKGGRDPLEAHFVHLELSGCDACGCP